MIWSEQASYIVFGCVSYNLIGFFAKFAPPRRHAGCIVIIVSVVKITTTVTATTITIKTMTTIITIMMRLATIRARPIRVQYHWLV